MNANLSLYSMWFVANIIDNQKDNYRTHNQGGVISHLSVLCYYSMIP